MPAEIDYNTPAEIDPQGRYFYVIGMGWERGEGDADGGDGADEAREAHHAIYIDAVYGGASGLRGQVWRVSTASPTDYKIVSQVLYRKTVDGGLSQEFTHPLTHDQKLYDAEQMVGMPQSITRLSELASTINEKFQTGNLTTQQLTERGVLSDSDLKEILSS